jgi:hypothetical protein
VVVCLVAAACGNDPGLLLDVDPGSPEVASVEVFVPKNTAGDGLGLPPNGTAKLDGTIYEVVDSIAAARDSNGRVRILLQPGDLGEVPALLVLGYDGNHTPIASAVVTDPSGSIHLPAATTVQLQVTLAASSYVVPASAGQPTAGVQIARWSETGSGGDLDGPCIAVLAGGGNSFFTAEGDLDCDGKSPDCDDTRYRYVQPVSSLPLNPVCASQDLDPLTQDACRLGQTISCTDGVGTCSPRTSNGGAELPVCVPVTLCDSCPNSDDLTGTSGLDATCEMKARMDQKTLRVDCKLAVTTAAPGGVQPCPAAAPVDLTGYVGDRWICAGAPLGFLTSYSTTIQPGTIRVGGNGTIADYVIAAHCGMQSGVAVSFDLNVGGAAGPVTNDIVGVLVVGVRDGSSTTSTTTDILGLPFHLSYVPAGSDACPQQAMTCQIVADSGDPKDDPMWHCAGR